jgi:hypothetical protein
MSRFTVAARRLPVSNVRSTLTAIGGQIRGNPWGWWPIFGGFLGGIEDSTDGNRQPSAADRGRVDS